MILFSLSYFLFTSLAVAEKPLPTSYENNSSYLRLYIMPSYPVKIDWSSPKSLLTSTLNATFLNANHPISHVNIEIYCGQSKAHHFAGAVSSRSSQSKDLLLTQKVGFSILELGWPGKLEEPDKIYSSIQYRAKKEGALSIATYLVSEATCQRLQTYLFEYSSLDNLYYGFSPRPRFKEGSGCSAFAASFLEIAGILTPALEAMWMQERRVPLALMAGYIGRREISLAELRNSPFLANWSSKLDPHMFLKIFDPDLMHLWTTSLFQNPEILQEWNGTSDTSSLAANFAQVPAVLFDFTLLPTPIDPVFLSEPRAQYFSDGTMIRADKTYFDNGSFYLNAR